MIQFFKRKLSNSNSRNNSRSKDQKPRDNTDSTDQIVDTDDWIPEPLEFEGLGRRVTLQDFTFGKVLGKGAYGKVVSVTSVASKRNYALKIIEKSSLRSTKIKAQLKQEIEIMRKIAHNNIIRYFSHFDDESKLYIVLELAEPDHLLTKLRREGILHEKVAAGYMFAVFKAVNYLHTQSPPIIHRDIKPENIVFVGATLKLTDFGWSGLKESLTRNTFCGTRDYLAPEMVRKKGHDEKLDIWTLGVLAFELCVGKTPFSPDSTVKDAKLYIEKLEYNVLQKEPKIPTYLTKELRSFLQQLLDKNPEKRPTCKQALKCEWFISNGYIFNDEKESVINRIITKSKEKMVKKKIKDFEKSQKLLLNIGEIASGSTKLNGPKLETSIQFNTPKNQSQRTWRPPVDLLKSSNSVKDDSLHDSQTTTEISEKDPALAFKILMKKYKNLKHSKEDLVSAIRLKDVTIKELEKECQDYKNLIIQDSQGRAVTQDIFNSLRLKSEEYERLFYSNQQLEEENIKLRYSVLDKEKGLEDKEKELLNAKQKCALLSQTMESYKQKNQLLVEDLLTDKQKLVNFIERSSANDKAKLSKEVNNVKSQMRELHADGADIEQILAVLDMLVTPSDEGQNHS